MNITTIKSGSVNGEDVQTVTTNYGPFTEQVYSVNQDANDFENDWVDDPESPDQLGEDEGFGVGEDPDGGYVSPEDAYGAAYPPGAGKGGWDWRESSPGTSDTEDNPFEVPLYEEVQFNRRSQLDNRPAPDIEFSPDEIYGGSFGDDDSPGCSMCDVSCQGSCFQPGKSAVDAATSPHHSVVNESEYTYASKCDVSCQNSCNLEASKISAHTSPLGTPTKTTQSVATSTAPGGETIGTPNFGGTSCNDASCGSRNTSMSGQSAGGLSGNVDQMSQMSVSNISKSQASSVGPAFCNNNTCGTRMNTPINGGQQEGDPMSLYSQLSQTHGSTNMAASPSVRTSTAGSKFQMTEPLLIEQATESFDQSSALNVNQVDAMSAGSQSRFNVSEIEGMESMGGVETHASNASVSNAFQRPVINESNYYRDNIASNLRQANIAKRQSVAEHARLHAGDHAGCEHTTEYTDFTRSVVSSAMGNRTAGGTSNVTDPNYGGLMQASMNEEGEGDSFMDEEGEDEEEDVKVAAKKARKAGA